MRVIDTDSWYRKSQWDWFSAFQDPTFSIDSRMDITETLRLSKEREISSFALILYLVCSTLNRIPAFRIRILGGKVVEIDSAKAGYTLKTDDGGFVTASAETKYGFEKFLEEINENKRLYSLSSSSKKYNQDEGVNAFFCTCLPWMDFTSVKHPIPDKDRESQSVPRICWGRYTPSEGRSFMSLNITASHALMDGHDMSEGFIEIQKAFDNPEKYIEE